MQKEAMFEPRFLRSGNLLNFRYTPEGRNYNIPPGFQPRPPKDVQKEAKQEVRRRGGDVRHRLSVLAFSKVQFGQFRGMTFKWLVENVLGWCANLIVSMEMAGEEIDQTSHKSVNKFALKEYLQAFPEGREAVKQKKDEKKKPVMERQEQNQKRRAAGASQSLSGGPRTTASSKVEGEEYLGDTDLTDDQLLAALSVLESSEATTSSTRQRAVPDEGDKSEYLLTEGWKRTLPRPDHQWVSRAFFKESAQGKPEFNMDRITQLWFYPPQPQFQQGQPPKPARYFTSRLLMWMPRKLWGLKLVCPSKECNGQELTSGGVHPTVRQVIDVDGFYNLAAEYLECRRCHRKIISWSKPILDQLDTGHRLQFPIVLTYRFACDMSIVRMLRDRTLGNGPFQMIRKLKEAHTGAWLRKTALYVSAVQEFIAASERGLIDRPKCAAPPAMPSLPTYHWLLSVYCNDVLERIDEVKASITSTFGRILKMDSTKKITRKLTGESAGTAAWATDVGNEHGQVLMSVLTAAEGAGLYDMIHGIVRRYAAAGQPQPELLYVDRGCCGAESRIFREWPDMPVRLDIWHFMRRLARGCTTEQHQLYPFFLRRLSACIFTWSADDLEQLIEAKKGQLGEKSVTCPSDDDVLKRIGRREIAQHCRRTTRGTEETTRLIGDLLAALDGEEGRDTLGVPLFDSDRIWQIWDSQQKHVACIQDPPEVQLYTKVGEKVKGGITLPVYRCARGSTSLESFHLHMNRFIPGTSANNVHFQAYLLEGVHRWNCDRARDAEGAAGPSHSSYGTFYEFDINRLTEQLFGKKINPTLAAPQQYTGELIGLEYLLHQSSQELLPMHPDEVEGDDDDGEDVGRQEGEDLEDPTQPPPEFGVRPASSRRSPRLSSREPTARVVSTAMPPRQISPAPSSPVASTTHRRPTRSKAPATESRAPDSPPLPTSGASRTSRAPATVSKAPDSPTIADTLDDFPMAEDDEFKDTEDVELKEESDEEYTCRDNIVGYDRVEALAQYLLEFRDDDAMVSKRNAERIVELWNTLDPDDREVRRPPRYKEKLTKGRFKAKGSPVVPGVESTRRCFLGNNARPASKPNANRIMECLIKKLCSLNPGHKREKGRLVPRWPTIIRAYKNIRSKAIASAHITSNTQLQLLEINQHTLINWHNRRSKDEEQTTLKMGVSAPRPSLTTSKPLPPPTERPLVLPAPPIQRPFQFPTIANTAGQATMKTPVAQPTFILLPIRVPSTSTSASTPGLRPIRPGPAPTQSYAPLTQRYVPTPDIPRSTLAYRKRRAKAAEEGRVKRVYKPRKGPTMCRQCHMERDSRHHTQYYGSWYCSRAQTQPLEEWKAMMSERRIGKKKKD